ncbi:efflux RND transporter periplasmic adaptor subunit [Archangium violaceum]|uniref:efflux RND transporter periplasmic adaptor subunit n=1 Tax=Archangium violaceum TaxID=83451 RepID=UPI00193B83CA|nr:efflux RND transporter periplasmic adaptor subunit [Archangium violaceum]QRK08859.1 efflux RND transporter periplasmic adaptor subunit [Archangium violaceum]
MKSTLRKTACVTMLALAACGKPAPEAARSAELVARPVSVVPVEKGAVVETVALVGELEGMEEVRVSPVMPERILSLAVKEGVRVKQGDLLATLHGDLQSESLNQAQAALEAARANRDAVEDNLKRTRELLASGSVTKAQLEALEAQYRGADAQVRQASAAVAQASAQRSRTTIRSPISGVVAAVHLREGDLAGAGSPVVTVVKSERLKAVLRVPERDFLRVREGMPVRVSPLARPEQTVEGQVSLKGPVVDRTTRTGLVEVHLDNKEGQLVAGSAIRATIELSRREGVVLVPAEAVLLEGDTERTGLATAFVADGQKASRRQVRVGVRQGDRMEIREGLAAGEQLIVQGVHLLRDGNPILLAGNQKEAGK